MTNLLRTFVAYAACVLLGGIIWRLAIPEIAALVRPEFFTSGTALTQAQIEFGYYVFIRTGLVWGAASLAALTALLMREHRVFRRLLLALPIIAPFVYALVALMTY
jgi:hypothetical protein